MRTLGGMRIGSYYVRWVFHQGLVGALALVVPSFAHSEVKAPAPENCADCGQRAVALPKLAKVQNLASAHAQAEARKDCLKQLSTQDLEVLNRFESTLAFEVKNLFSKARSSPRHSLHADVKRLLDAGARWDAQAGLQLQSFPFAKLSSDSALRNAFIRLFPSSKKRIAAISDPKRKDTILIEGFALLPPYLKIAAPGQKFTPAIPIEKYHQTLVSELRALDGAFREYLAASRKGGSMSDLIHEFSAHWTNDFWKRERWEREHEASQRSASSEIYTRTERLIQKWGIRGDAMHRLLDSLAAVQARAASGREAAVNELLEKVVATTLSPLLVPVAAMGWMPAAGAGIALTLADAGISAGLNQYELGGDAACHLAKQLDRKFPQGFLMSLAFSPVGALGQAAHTEAVILRTVPVKTLAKVGLGIMGAAGVVQAVDSVQRVQPLNEKSQKLEKTQGMQSELTRAARADTRESVFHAARDTAFALTPVTELTRPKFVESLLAPAPLRKVHLGGRQWVQGVLRKGSSEKASMKPEEVSRVLEESHQAFVQGAEADLSDPAEALLFDIYRKKYFGKESRSENENIPLRRIISTLGLYPELGFKEPFRSIEWISKGSEAPVPESLKLFIRSSINSAKALLAKYYQVDAYIGFWRRILQDSGDLSEWFTPVVRAKLLNPRGTPDGKAMTLSVVLTRRMKELQAQGKDVRAISQVIANVIHTVGYLDGDILHDLGSSDGRQVLSGFRHVLDSRDRLAMLLGYEDHFAGALKSLGVSQPAGIPSERRLPEILGKFSAEVEAGSRAILSTQNRTIRQLSATESPFRSCLGGSDCSSSSYLTRALDPNYHYFTMTDSNGASSGQVTVVLGEGQLNGQRRLIAFVDKVQNVMDPEIPYFLEGIRQSMAEKGYILALPEEKGGHNGISNYLETTRFIDRFVPVLGDQLIEGYRPHPHHYQLDSRYSRADQRLRMNPIKPLGEEKAKFLRLGQMPNRAPLDSEKVKNLTQAIRDLPKGDEKSKLVYLTELPSELLRQLEPNYVKKLIEIVRSDRESSLIRGNALNRLIFEEDQNLGDLLKKVSNPKVRSELLEIAIQDERLRSHYLNTKRASQVLPYLKDATIDWNVRFEAILMILREGYPYSSVETIADSLEAREVKQVLERMLRDLRQDQWEILHLRRGNRQIESRFSSDKFGSTLRSLVALSRRVPELQDEAIRMFLEYGRNDSPLDPGDRTVRSMDHWREDRMNGVEIRQILRDEKLNTAQTSWALAALQAVRRPKTQSQLLLATETLVEKLPQKSDTALALREELLETLNSETVSGEVLSRYFLTLLAQEGSSSKYRYAGLELIKGLNQESVGKSKEIRAIASMAEWMSVSVLAAPARDLPGALLNYFGKAENRQSLRAFLDSYRKVLETAPSERMLRAHRTLKYWAEARH